MLTLILLLVVCIVIYEVRREHAINLELLKKIRQNQQNEDDIKSLSECRDRIVELERNLVQRDEFVRNIQAMFFTGTEEDAKLIDGDRNVDDVLPELLEELTVYKAMVEKLASLDLNEHRKQGFSSRLQQKFNK